MDFEEGKKEEVVNTLFKQVMLLDKQTELTDKYGGSFYNAKSLREYADYIKSLGMIPPPEDYEHED
jgi:hypothetical protein